MEAYYHDFYEGDTRAEIFKTHISIDSIKYQVFLELIEENDYDPMTTLKNEYADTYHFIKSMEEGTHVRGTYS